MNLVPLKCDGPAGAAFLLRGPARHDLPLFHPEGTVSIRSGSVYFMVRLARPLRPVHYGMRLGVRAGALTPMLQCIVTRGYQPWRA